jgi:osmoprotectant transport system permease protein
VSRAIPTLALLTVFSATAIGFGNRATIIALAVFAIPPLLTNTYVGVREVDPDIVEAARGMGLSAWAVLTRVELPLAVPAIIGGLRIAVVSTVSIATIASFLGEKGLGYPIFLALKLPTPFKTEIYAAGALVVALALGLDLVLVLTRRILVPWSRA